MSPSKSSEFSKCKWSIRGLELGVLMFIIAVILFATTAQEMSDAMDNKTSMSDEGKMKMTAGAVLMFISLFVVLFSSLSATYSGCFRTAIIGSFLTMFMLF